MKDFSVYGFFDKENVLFYVGQTKYFKKRKAAHLNKIKNGKDLPYLNKARKSSFKIEIIKENLTKEEANILELKLIEENQTLNQLKKTVSEKSYKHGKCYSQIYNAWNNAKGRCLNKKNDDYPEYGGRGILFSAEWLDNFALFYKEMGNPPTPKHSLGRIDNEKGYSKKNCRWETMSEQARNTRRNHVITYKNKTQCMIDWAEEINMSYFVLRGRLEKGWSIKRAFEQKVRKSPSKIGE